MVERPNQQPEIVIDERRVLIVVKRLFKARAEGSGFFKGVTVPEEGFVKLIKEFEEKERIDGFALHALFFMTSTLFADNSTRALNFVSEPWRFRLYSYLFQPEKVVTRSEDQLLKDANDFIRPGYNRRAIEKWMHNARVIVNKYDGKLINFFAQHDMYVPAILPALIGPKRKHIWNRHKSANDPDYYKEWDGFHRFGDKIARLFLLWVHKYDVARLKNIDEIGIPIDFQVMRVLAQTAGYNLDEPTHKGPVLKALIPFFTEFCKKYNFSPLDVAELIWLVGHTGCNNYLHTTCPLAEFCDKLISRKPLDSAGLIDPTDTGRWETRKTLRAKKLGQLAFPVNL